MIEHEGISGLAKVVVRMAEQYRKGGHGWLGLGWSSRSDLKFYSMIIIADKNVIDDETPF